MSCTRPFPVSPGLKALADFRLKPVLRQGFTLIEILVATTILLIIVLLMSMVFQQSSGAYQSGTTRVNAQKVLRNIMGVISRDMTLAVDSRFYEFDDGRVQQFDGNKVAFVALTGSPDAAGRRSPQWIEFSYSAGEVKRRCAELKWNGTKWAENNSLDTQQSTLNPDYNLVDFSFGITDHPQDKAGLPLRVDVYGELETSGTFSFARGRSAGRDRKFGTDDDIIAGGQ